MNLAIIPARLGSKRCPGKNMADLYGRPMIEWSIEAAFWSQVCDQIVVTTDDPAVKEFIIGEYPDDVVWLIDRPSSLAQDNTPMLPVLKHAISEPVIGSSFSQAEIITLLQPTSPFRTAEDIVGAYKLLKRSGGDAVVSTTEAEEDLNFGLGHANRLMPRPGIVVPNGAIYIITAESLARGENWYTGIAYAYPMPKDRSLDINTPLDLTMARAVAEHNNGFEGNGSGYRISAT
jgi:CMP-N,N'-diacetyllegionaminic acid synthase